MQNGIEYTNKDFWKFKLKILEKRSALLYTYSTGVTMVSSFIIVLLLIKFLNPIDYGKAVIIRAQIAIVIAITSLGLSQSYIHWRGQTKNDVEIINQYKSTVILGCIISGLLFGITNIIIFSILKFQLNIFLISILLILSGIAQSFVAENLNFRRGDQEPFYFAL